mgnify:CR=1 FL=1
MNLVSEWITRSAPSASGRYNDGGVNVLSMVSSTPCWWASAASAATSATLVVGLAMVSACTSRVFGRNAARTASRSATSTKVASMP